METKRWSTDMNYFSTAPPMMYPYSPAHHLQSSNNLHNPDYANGTWYSFVPHQPPFPAQSPHIPAGCWTLYPPISSAQIMPQTAAQSQQRRASVPLMNKDGTIIPHYANNMKRNNRFGGSGVAPLPAGLDLPVYFQLRGPPRKPRHGPTSMWVGNVPRSTNILELRDLFSTGLKNNLQSVFWMAKTSCAFVNYNTVSSCKDAVDRFHQIVFKDIQLNCRLRENGITQDLPLRAGSISPTFTRFPASPVLSQDDVPSDSTSSSGTLVGCSQKRYFVAKSLTRDDLVTSTQHGVWTSQSRVGKLLQQALKDSEEVYLVFSANRSGQYFGYARLLEVQPRKLAETISPQNKLSTAAGDSLLPPNMIRCIDTPEVENALAGTIHDDSERGILYWEALRGSTKADEQQTDIPDVGDEFDGSGFVDFKVKWISTRPVSFHRTRNLFNSMNEGKPVKVAKDGTEIDEQTAKALLNLWS